MTHFFASAPYPPTSLKQDAGNASLASIDGKTPALSGGKVPVTNPTSLPLPGGAATEAKQDSEISLLQTLVGPVARTARLVAFNPGGNVTINNARQLSILNTSTTVSVTVNDFYSTITLGPGMGVEWPLLGMRESAYQSITVDCPSGAAGLISWVA